MGGPAPEVKVGEEQWKSMEVALDREISTGVRIRLIDLTNNFLSFAPAEVTAEPISGTEKRLAKIRKAAGALQKVLIEDRHNEADFFADHLIELNFDDARLGKREKIDSLTGLLTSLIASCMRAQGDIDGEVFAEHKPGQAWAVWIRNLTKLLRENDLPTHARKDSDKTWGGQASPFVQFIDRLQACFDPKYRRGSHSKVALAEAITLARRVENGRRKPAIKTR